MHLTDKYADKLLKGENQSNIADAVINWATSRENLSSGFPTKRDSNPPAQLQILDRELKFRS